MKVPARTVRREAALEGIGLHSGLRTRAWLRPAPPGSGLVFIRDDLPGHPRLTLKHICAAGPAFRTTLKDGPVEVHTIEHLLSALHGLFVTDLEVTLDGAEMPGMDGSALPFAQAMLEAGWTDSAAPEVDAVAPAEPMEVADGAARLAIQPWADGLHVDYTLHYDGEPLAQGRHALTVTPETYLSEIAPARTFCLYREAQGLLAAGFGKGAGTHNTLVLDNGHVLDNSLRFPDEPVRHKILDLLGDLYLLGRPLRGRVTAHRSGHGLNRLMVRQLANPDAAR